MIKQIFEAKQASQKLETDGRQLVGKPRAFDEGARASNAQAMPAFSYSGASIIALIAFLSWGGTLHHGDETEAGIKRIPSRMPDSLTGPFYCALRRLFLVKSTSMNRLLLISFLLFVAGRAFGGQAYDYYNSGATRED